MDTKKFKLTDIEAEWLTDSDWFMDIMVIDMEGTIYESFYYDKENNKICGKILIPDDENGTVDEFAELMHDCYTERVLNNLEHDEWCEDLSDERKNRLIKIFKENKPNITVKKFNKEETKKLMIKYIDDNFDSFLSDVEEMLREDYDYECCSIFSYELSLLYNITPIG